MQNRIPVTIITGFLGAGKTTFLNNIISQNKDIRFAIIENEFGEIGIDNELIIGIDDGIFELSNGCICCTLNSELTELLVKLIDRQDEYDHLLIETTGIADPSSVAAAFISDYEVQQHFQLDGIICLVDSMNVEATLKVETKAPQQIGFADVLIFNKKDKVEPNQLQTITTNIQQLNPYAQVIEAEQANIETSTLLKLKAYEPSNVEKKTVYISHNHDHQHEHITSQAYSFDQPFDLLKLRHFIKVLLLLQSMRIYRMKGILYIKNEDYKIIFQAVQQQTIFSKGSKWGSDEKRESKLLIIGNNLNKTMFEKKLRQCLV